MYQGRFDWIRAFFQLESVIHAHIFIIETSIYDRSVPILILYVGIGTCICTQKLFLPAISPNILYLRAHK